jgi:hypothetical protein
VFLQAQLGRAFSRGGNRRPYAHIAALGVAAMANADTSFRVENKVA